MSFHTNICLHQRWLRIATSFAITLAFLGTAKTGGNDSIKSLKAIGEKVAQVVNQNRDACVALVDGFGSGSGVIVSETGLVLTAGHVIENTNLRSFEIVLSSGRRVKAKPLGYNLNNDLGMAQILEPGPWPHAKINQDGNLNRGDWVVSVGHSGGWELGRDAPVRTGRYLKMENSQLVTDAVLIGGDSGGPLFNLEGEVIGIHSSIGDSVSENRHIPIELFIADWQRLEDGEQWGMLANLGRSGPRRPLIGVTVDLTADECIVTSVYRNSPAQIAGIRAGDIITQFNNSPIASGQQLIDAIRKQTAGKSYPISVRRGGRTLEFEITPQ